jgi:hypothetical protein
LPASKASGLIMVNVLFPAMGLGFALVYFGRKNRVFRFSNTYAPENYPLGASLSVFLMLWDFWKIY